MRWQSVLLHLHQLWEHELDVVIRISTNTHIGELTSSLVFFLASGSFSGALANRATPGQTWTIEKMTLNSYNLYVFHNYIDETL